MASCLYWRSATRTKIRRAASWRACEVIGAHRPWRWDHADSGKASQRGDQRTPPDAEPVQRMVSPGHARCACMWIVQRRRLLPQPHESARWPCALFLAGSSRSGLPGSTVEHLHLTRLYVADCHRVKSFREHFVELWRIYHVQNSGKLRPVEDCCAIAPHNGPASICGAQPQFPVKIEVVRRAIWRGV